MKALSAFVKASGTRTVLGSDSKVISDDLQKFRHFRSMVEPIERPKYDSLVLHWYVAENTAPDAGELFCRMLEGKKIECKSSGKIRKSELKGLLPDDPDLDILMICYDLIGVEGSIEVNPGKDDRIDVHDSYRFDLTASIETKAWIRSSAKVMLVDGYIEHVSEIHHVLQKCSESKVPLIIFARGYSGDVLNTISVNVTRQTIDILPFTIKLDLGQVNDFYDLSILTGAQVISSEKGQLISSSKFEELPSVTYVRYSPYEKMLVMRNDSTRPQVMQHLRKLREKLESTDAYNLNELTGRIRKMTSLVCMVTFKDDLGFQIRKDSFKRASRLIDHYSRFGRARTSVGDYPKSSYDIAARHAADALEKLESTVTLRF